jgi:YD repeat-containing protein
VVQRTYAYGLERISETQAATGTTSYYGYDAHGDVRFLMDGTGKVTDTYDYDAFGNVVGSTGTTANVYRCTGRGDGTVLHEGAVLRFGGGAVPECGPDGGRGGAPVKLCGGGPCKQARSDGDAGGIGE